MGCTGLTRQHSSAPRRRGPCRLQLLGGLAGRGWRWNRDAQPPIGSRAPRSRGPWALKRSPSAPGTTLPCPACAQRRSTAASCWLPGGRLRWARPANAALSPPASCPALTPGHGLWACLTHCQDRCARRRVWGESQRMSTVPTHPRHGQDAREHTRSVLNQTLGADTLRASRMRHPESLAVIQRFPDMHPSKTHTHHTHCTEPSTRAAERHARGIRFASQPPCHRATAAPCLSRPSPPRAGLPRLGAPRACPSLLLLVQARASAFWMSCALGSGDPEATTTMKLCPSR